MPTSVRKLMANRANAQKSTGPRDPELKAKVAQNRTLHGLTGHFHVMKGEDQQKFENLFDELMRDEKPVGSAEVELVRKMAEHTWLARRATKCQEACFQVDTQTAEQVAKEQHVVHINQELDRFLRYQAHHDRCYQRAANELLRRKKERQLEARGFESQKRAEAEQERQIEKHTQAMAVGKARLQSAEIRAAKQFADVLPPDFFQGPLTRVQHHFQNRDA